MDWMIYGANGYTGALTAREAKRRGAAPILAGRHAAKIAQLAIELSLPSKAFSLNSSLDVAAALTVGPQRLKASTSQGGGSPFAIKRAMAS